MQKVGIILTIIVEDVVVEFVISAVPSTRGCRALTWR